MLMGARQARRKAALKLRRPTPDGLNNTKSMKLNKFKTSYESLKTLITSTDKRRTDSFALFDTLDAFLRAFDDALCDATTPDVVYTLLADCSSLLLAKNSAGQCVRDSMHASGRLVPHCAKLLVVGIGQWGSCLDESQQAEFIDAYFVSGAHFAALSALETFDATLRTMRRDELPRASRRSIFACLAQYATQLVGGQLFDALAQPESLGVLERDAWTRLCASICLWPSVAGNLMERELEDAFSPSSFYSMVADTLVRYLTSVTEPVRLERAALLFARVLSSSSRNYVHLLDRVAMLFVSSSISETIKLGKGVQSRRTLLAWLLNALSSADAQRVVWHLLERVSVPLCANDSLVRRIEQIFGSLSDDFLVMKESGVARSVVLVEAVTCTRLVTSRHSRATLAGTYSVPVVCALIDYACKVRLRHGSASWMRAVPSSVELAYDVGGLWCDADALAAGNAARDQYVTGALFFWLAKLDVSEARAHSRLVRRLMDGVHKRLGSASGAVHATAMHIGEAVAPLLSADASLKFDDKVPLDYLFSTVDDAERAWARSAPVGGNTTPNGPHPSEKVPVRTLEHAASSLRSASSSASSSPSVSRSSSSSSILIPYDRDESDDEGERSDDDVDASTNRDVEPILYVRQCLRGLGEQEDFRVHRDALQRCETLVRSAATNDADVNDVAEQICTYLLHLRDRFALDGFATLRHRALLACAVSAPRSVVPRVAAEFFAADYDIQQRLLMLDVLGDAAQELAALDFGATAERDGGARAASSPVEVVGKSRRWGYATASAPSRAPKTAVNRFLEHAELFFYALIYGHERNAASLRRELGAFDLLGSDPLLLGRLVHCLAVIVECASTHVRIDAMRQLLLRYALSVRYHVEPYVRRTVAFAVHASLQGVRRRSADARLLLRAPAVAATDTTALSATLGALVDDSAAVSATVTREARAAVHWLRESIDAEQDEVTRDIIGGTLLELSESASST